MKKTKLEIVMDFVELIHAIHEKTPHYAELQFSNFGSELMIAVMENGFRDDGSYDLFDYFNLDNSEKIEKAKKYLNRLLSR